MAEPQIRYARTSDGISIAYYTMGEGESLVVTSPLGYSHIQLERRYEPLRAWYDRLATRRCVVRFDWRGQGLSQRNLSAFPPRFGVLDLAAVVAALGRGAIDLLGCGGGGHYACEFAAAYPELVNELILWAAPFDSAWGSEQVEATHAIAGMNYVAFTEATSAAILGWSDPIAAHRWAQFMRAAVSEEDYETYRKTYEPAEQAVETLAGIHARTLVLHPAGMRNMPVANAQKWAAAIAGASLVITTDDRSGLPFGEQATTAIEDFLDGEPGQPAGRPAPPESRPRHGTAIILLTDIADSTALTERLGDAAFRERARSLEEALRSAARNHSGTVIDAKTLGDGILATFPAASQAIAAALACSAAGEALGLPLHLGLHAGDVIRESDNVYGGAVNIASRICAMCEPGEVLVSQTVRDLARTSAGVEFEDRGEQALKGVSDAVRVFAVRSAAEG
jgi:class 3 adenylate cyclase